MNRKKCSTFEREMKDKKFRAAFEHGYREFLLSEVLNGLMDESKKTVRGFAQEVGLSPSLIQKMRSGAQQDVKLSNFLSIAEACGYHVCLYKGRKRIEL